MPVEKKPVTTPYLPHLIFAETHTDPTTARIINKLIPELTKQGYHHFYDELPKTTTIPGVLEFLKTAAQEYQLIKNGNAPPVILKGKKWGKYSPNDATIMLHDARQTWHQCYTTMQKHHIYYHGIDLPKTTSDTAEIQMYPRDKRMAKAYLTAAYPTIGRIGFAHAQGIQNRILRHVSKEIAEKNFLFFNISATPSENNDKSLNTPLEIIPLDSTQKTDEEIISFILKKIAEKKRLAYLKPLTILTTAINHFNEELDLFEVSIDGINNKTEIIFLSPTDTIIQLKEKLIESIENKPLNKAKLTHQNLQVFFANKQLEDNKIVSDYPEIKETSYGHAIIKPHALPIQIPTPQIKPQNILPQSENSNTHILKDFKAKINTYITDLNNEIQAIKTSWFFYFRQSQLKTKILKRNCMKEMSQAINLNDLQNIAKKSEKNSKLTCGFFSTRTKNLMIDINNPYKAALRPLI